MLIIVETYEVVNKVKSLQHPPPNLNMTDPGNIKDKIGIKKASLFFFTYTNNSLTFCQNQMKLW